MPILIIKKPKVSFDFIFILKYDSNFINILNSKNFYLKFVKKILSYLLYLVKKALHVNVA
jgi:hypothetical protein